MLFIKRVMQITGALIDLSKMTLAFNMGGQVLPIEELETGHIAVDLVARVSDQDKDWLKAQLEEAASGGAECAVVELPIQEPLSNEGEVSEPFAVHVAQAPVAGQPSSENESEKLFTNQARRRARRARDEPFFNVCVPRWRERAQEFSLSRARRPSVILIRDARCGSDSESHGEELDQDVLLIVAGMDSGEPARTGPGCSDDSRSTW